MASEAAILLKDIQGEKSGRLQILKTNSTKPVYRGELLLTISRDKVIPRKDGKPPHNYYLASDPAVTLFCSEHDIAPLSDYDFSLMEAVKSREDRYDVFVNDILEWGSELKTGTFVTATMPSKSPVPNQSTLSRVGYVGPLPNERGIQFGVEIMDPTYRGHGYSNGFFGNQQFFTCEENCAMFVPLDRLKPMEDQKNPQQPQPSSDERKHPMTTRSQNDAQQKNPSQQGHRTHSPKPSSSRFKVYDRVIVHDKNGIGVHGSVRWIENVKYGGDVLLAIGIETDIAVQSKDFEGSLIGFSQHFKCLDSRHGKLVMPEPFVNFEHVDAARREEQKKVTPTPNQGSSVDPRAVDDDRLMQQAKVQSEDDYLKGALNTKMVNRQEQIRALNEIEKAQTERRQKLLQNITDRGQRYEPIPGFSGQPSNQQPHPQHSSAVSGARPHHHEYESPDRTRRELVKMREQRSVQDEQLLGYHGSSAGGTPPLHHQRSMPSAHADAHLGLSQPPVSAQPPQQFEVDKQDHTYSNFTGGPQQTPLPHQQEWRNSDPSTYQNLPYLQNQGYQQDHHGYQQSQGYQSDQRGVPPAHVAVHAPPGPQTQYGHDHPQPGVQLQGEPGQSQMSQFPSGQPGEGGTAMAYASEEILHQFTMGSTVELLSDPPRYGVIQWIGSIPNFQGRIAGVELEEPMEGCGDGLWQGVRYFSCRQRHGFFCPLASLRPDQRFAQHAVVNVNPLDYVAMEEQRDQHINLGQIKRYIGEEKGIQGQQNSCYLDSTVFGLFAVSDAFDSMFLQQQTGDPAGDEVKHLLWKGIVNPLRKNGVVRHESVMCLRNKLEELGKMKGVNQDEKDPEEFLNMLFKHTLHVPPFINIKRPYGVEQEYFVQLFVEPDDSLKLPTVEDLLARMFKEQKIRFTKVPSKLLVQIPRYGREFKTFKKTIPSLKLNLKGLLSSKRRCFICGDCAWNECSQCVSHFTSSTPETSNVVYFCESCAKLAHGKTSGRDTHRITDVASDPGKINELDLLSVICIETSHYICFTRSDDRWVFFDSMANRVNDMYNIPKVVDCTDALNEWVYPASGDLSRLMNTPPRELPEYVRRFTQDIYLCVYIQPDVGMYGDFEDEDSTMI